MYIQLEDKIREALLALRWNRDGDGPNSGYFVNAASGTVQLETNAASFLAHFITERVANDNGCRREDSLDTSLDNYSLEVIASYLEDHGYIVTSSE